LSISRRYWPNEILHDQSSSDPRILGSNDDHELVVWLHPDTQQRPSCGFLDHNQTDTRMVVVDEAHNVDAPLVLPMGRHGKVGVSVPQLLSHGVGNGRRRN
jgi:hypothetical protein